MSATADLILERRQVRRRLTFWRIVAIVAIVVAAIAVIPQTVGPGIGDHLARIRIDGMIFDDPDRAAMLKRIAESDRVKGVILHINSPGGTVAGSEALYEDLRRIAERKPLVAVMSEAAASGGYIAAIAADHIVARGNTLTGSIGVIAEIPNVAGLLEMLGIGVTRVKSAPLKAEPSLVAPPSEAALAAERELIADSFAWFRDLVAERRKMDPDTVRKVADGRLYTGRQALALDLIDGLGDEEMARDWLASDHQLGPKLSVADYDWTESPLPWPASIFENSLAGWLPSGPIPAAGPRLYAVIQ